MEVRLNLLFTSFHVGGIWAYYRKLLSSLADHRDTPFKADE